MIEQRVPVIARWMVYALGVVDGRRVRRPIDPVAAWLLKEHPGLLPTVPQPALLSTIRARTDLVDRMVVEELARARTLGHSIAYWSFGGGFDARWHRLAPDLADVVEHREIESADIVDFKARVLAGSPFAERWARVASKVVHEDAWTVTPHRHARALAVIEAGAGRLDEDALRRTLYRIRSDSPTTRVIVGLPTTAGSPDGRWSRRAIATLGWRVDEDVHVATRGRLMANTGSEVCPGMYPFRVVRLSARELLQP